MRLHPNTINQALLLLNEWVLGISVYFLDFSHVYALLGLLDRLFGKAKHVLEGLHVEDELRGFRLGSLRRFRLVLGAGVFPARGVRVAARGV